MIDVDVDYMSANELRAEVKKLRAGIRTHRDSSGHHLCWFVPELWNLLPDKISPEPEIPLREEFLAKLRSSRAS